LHIREGQIGGPIPELGGVKEETQSQIGGAKKGGVSKYGESPRPGNLRIEGRKGETLIGGRSGKRQHPGTRVSITGSYHAHGDPQNLGWNPTAKYVWRLEKMPWGTEYRGWGGVMPGNYLIRFKKDGDLVMKGIGGGRPVLVNGKKPDLCNG